MTPKIHDAATVEAAKLCTYYPRASVDFQAANHDAWLKARELIWPMREKDELNTVEVGNRLKDEHIAGLEQRVKELTEWRPMESAPRDGRFLVMAESGDVYSVESCKGLYPDSLFSVPGAYQYKRSRFKYWRHHTPAPAEKGGELSHG